MLKVNRTLQHLCLASCAILDDTEGKDYGMLCRSVFEIASAVKMNWALRELEYVPTSHMPCSCLFSSHTPFTVLINYVLLVQSLQENAIKESHAIMKLLLNASLAKVRVPVCMRCKILLLCVV